MDSIANRIDFNSQTWFAIRDFLVLEEARVLDEMADDRVPIEKVPHLRLHLMFIRQLKNLKPSAEQEPSGLY